MNKLTTAGALIPLLILAAPEAFADPQHCYSYDGHGYSDGQTITVL
jgi:hypothetical protein